MVAADYSISRFRGYAAIVPHLPALQQLAEDCGQPGTMHGIDLLLQSQFARRKQPNLLCFYRPATSARESGLVGAVLLLEYCFLGMRTGAFATGDAFGVRTVAAPQALQPALCYLAGQHLLRAGARVLLITARVPDGSAVPDVTAFREPGAPWLDAGAVRMVQDTLILGPSADATLARLGKRTRVHMRADRRRFDGLYPEAELLDATAWLAAATDGDLAVLNREALDTIAQDEFNHQIRSICGSPGGLALGLRLHGRWISLIGGWRQGTSTWIEWQCNRRGFDKLSLGSVLRTYLFEEEARHGTTHLSFHGGTSHSMRHRFQNTVVTDFLMRRPGLVTGVLVRLVPWLCRAMPTLLQRGNFLLNALAIPGLHWHR